MSQAPNHAPNQDSKVPESPGTNLEVVLTEPVRDKSPESLVAMIRQVVPLAGVPQFFDRAYTEIVAALHRVHRSPTGPPLGVSYGLPGETIDLGAAFPIATAIPQDGDVTTVTIPACEVATLTVHGAYDQISSGYDRLLTFINEIGMQPGPVAWEEYLTMPEPGGNPTLNVTQLRWMLV
ncbi:GyrI-like domain-containing protein [Jonesiaceae bacterium BS-20]|uniref:GyrI-like domain-containing protein n=1 Tax=Jonesiaceae bacterium BS-20 TaxID=3120821 RepID=A0AAU7DXX4_9MICO